MSGKNVPFAREFPLSVYVGLAKFGMVHNDSGFGISLLYKITPVIASGVERAAVIEYHAPDSIQPSLFHVNILVFHI